MRIRPGRTRSLIGGIAVIAVTILGLAIMPRSAVPGGMPGGLLNARDPFGIFRIVWILLGLIGAGISFYNAFSRKGVALYEIDGGGDLYRNAPEESNLCPKCGKSIGKEDRFCRNCGTYLRA